jgi:hypothetical protein
MKALAGPSREALAAIERQFYSSHISSLGSDLHMIQAAGLVTPPAPSGRLTAGQDATAAELRQAARGWADLLTKSLGLRATGTASSIMPL